MLTRRATLAPKTRNLEARTCEALISSGAAVLRRGSQPDGRGFGPWYEVLDLAEADLSRLRGASVLIDHVAYDSNARIGAVQSVRRTNEGLVAQLKFSGRAEVQPLLQDLSDGIGGKVSIGYVVEQWRSR